MKYSFIINPNSGNNKKKNIINKVLNTYTTYSIETFYTEYPGHAGEIARKQLANEVENIIAVGGDGTVNEVAGQLVGSQANLGIVPMGSGNGFARSIHLPLKPQHAIDTIFMGKNKRIDVGKVNERFFFAVSGTGLDANIASRFQKSIKRGPLPYFTNGLTELLNYSYPGFILQQGESQQSFNPLVITVANAAQFGNGAKIAPQADLQDGMLDICIVQKMSFWQTLQAALKMFNGTIDQISAYSAFKAERIEITSKNTEINYHIDGEPLRTTRSLVFEIVPNSLNVIIK